MTFDDIIRCSSAKGQNTVGNMMALYDGIDRQTADFAEKTGLRCKAGCGACCENPEIETTVAEVLPLAAHLWSEGLAQSKLEALVEGNSPLEKQGTVPFNSKKICVFYEPSPDAPGQGRCGIYAYRPGLCRLFGFAARRDKHGRQEFMTCKIIKDSQSQACARAQEELHNGLEAPLLAAHAFAVANIDPVHGQKLLPINQAIRLALEKVGYSIQKN